MSASNLAVLIPWMIFGAGVAAICLRLFSSRRASRNHQERPPAPPAASPGAPRPEPRQRPR